MSVSPSRLGPRLVAGVFASLLLVTGNLGAQVFELPAEIALDADALTFDLADAELSIEVRQAEPILRARVAEDDGGSARLEVSGVDGALTVSRPVDDEPTRLSIEAVIAPGQRLRLDGRRLTVILDHLPAGPADPPAPGAPSAAGKAAVRGSFQLSLESSEADLTGLRDPVLDLTSTAVWLTGTGGNLDLTLRGGSAEIRGHRGSLKLAASDAEVAIEDLRGPLTPRLVGGSLTVTGSRGNLDATLDNALLRLDGWRGAVQLRGTGATLEARAAGDAKTPWKIEGRGLRLVLEGVSGPVTATLDGGSFEGRGLRSKIVAVANNGARLDLAELAGSLRLNLTGGAEARVSDVGGALASELEDAFLEADGVGQLALTAARSRVVARRVRHLTRLEATDSELDLDLEAIRSPFLKLLGTSRASVRLTTPCLVQLQGPAAMVDRQVRLTGCDLLVPGQRLRGKQTFLRYGDHPLTTLKAQVSEDASLEVEGR